MVGSFLFKYFFNIKVILVRKIIIAHDVDGRIYFDAIKSLSDHQKISPIKYREVSVFKKTLSAIYKKNNIKLWLKRFFPNLFFRFSVPFIKDNIIILGMAPYNIRFLWYGLLAKKNKVIYHTSWPYWWTDNVPCRYPLGNKIIARLFEYYLSKYNFTIVGVTPATVNTISKKVNKHIYYIPHAVNLDIFISKKRVFDEASFEKNKKILFIGRMVKEKGIEDLVTLIQLSRKSGNNHEFTFIGEGPELKYIKDNLNEYKNVNVLGYLSDKSRISEIMQEHDFLVLPSRKTKGWEELFGLVIIEAMAAGMVVIATDHIGPKSIIKNNIDGIILPESNSLYIDMLNIINRMDNDKYKSISSKAIEAVNKYSVSSVMSQWEVVINND